MVNQIARCVVEYEKGVIFLGEKSTALVQASTLRGQQPNSLMVSHE